MNILFVSSLDGGKYTGPRYSVPKQITSQSYYDNVYWINLTDINTNFVGCDTECHNLTLTSLRIDNLPKPFNKPDLIVFEEFYKIPNAIFARSIEKKCIPYIIVPRSQMTKQYMRNKPLKKKVAAISLFNRFAKKAKSVQFLTEKEKDDSASYYSGEYHIVPNGIVMPSKQSERSYNDKVVGVFIGRYSIVQKGLDILFEAIKNNKALLKKHNVVFDLYGPDERTGCRKNIQKLCKDAGIEDIVTVNGAVFDNKKDKVLRNADFFIHTSRFEGLSMSILEALSYGLPCIVTDGTNIRNEVENAMAGWGCATSSEGIGQALKDFVDSIENLHIYSKHAIDLANQYSWDMIAKCTHDIYKDTI